MGLLENFLFYLCMSMCVHVCCVPGEGRRVTSLIAGAVGHLACQEGARTRATVLSFFFFFSKLRDFNGDFNGAGWGGAWNHRVWRS